MKEKGAGSRVIDGVPKEEEITATTNDAIGKKWKKSSLHARRRSRAGEDGGEELKATLDYIIGKVLLMMFL